MSGRIYRYFSAAQMDSERIRLHNLRRRLERLPRDTDMVNVVGHTKRVNEKITDLEMEYKRRFLS